MKESYRTFEYNITGVQRQKLKQKNFGKKYTLTPTPTPAPAPRFGYYPPKLCIGIVFISTWEL